MKYVVAVSGGIDSVVLLDMMIRKKNDVIVAHFDHGIRGDSAADERFVQALAHVHGVPYRSRREELGKHASEATARERRYTFLRAVADEASASIVTAHHMDDVVETVAINLIRGTGWRGLAVLDSPGVVRPLLGMTKRDMYDYALTHRLEWVEDETNKSGVYLRNRVRRTLNPVGDLRTSREIVRLRRSQVRLKRTIEIECERLIGDNSGQMSRYFFIMIDTAAADELLRSVLQRMNLPSTRPIRKRMLHEIKTARHGTISQALPGATIEFLADEFIVKPLERLL